MKLYLLLPLLWLSLLISPTLHAEPQVSLVEAFELLKKNQFKSTAEAIDLIVASGHERSHLLLDSLASGLLLIEKKNKRLVIGIKDGSQFQIRDALDDTDLGVVKKRKAKKIKINNQLRQKISAAQALMKLSDPDAETRLQALQQIVDAGTRLSPAQIEKLYADEDDRVVALAQLSQAFTDLNSSDRQVRLQAIEALQRSLNPLVRAKLQKMVDSDADATVQKAAATALKRIEKRVQYYGYLETLFFGLSAGSVLVLAAIGLAITFGVMGVINMAHGELIMIGAYVTYVLQLLLPNHIGLSILLAIPAAFVVSGLVGILIERGVIRFLYGRPLETLLATFGISLILQQAVRSIFSPLNRSVETPSWMSGSWQFNEVFSLTYNRIYILVFCLIVFFALQYILKKTPLGLQVRAVSQNRPMARAMGIKANRVDAMTFGLGSGIAGVAGVALSQLTNVGPNLGQAYIVDSFMVVVFGGVGNLWGTLIGGLSLGIANKFMEPWVGAVLAKILILVFIILFIQKRPRGLFPQKGRAAEG